MSNNLEFAINAKDNASKVVATVEKKIANFGSDLAKGFLSFAGPMALVNNGISAISSAIDDYKQKFAEAFKYGSSLKDVSRDVNVTVEEYQRLESAAVNSGIAVNSLADAYNQVKAAIEAAKDPTSAQSLALRALGFAAADIESGNLKAIDVMEKLGKAMASGTSDTEQFNIAASLLGTTVAKLIPILKEAALVKDGFTNPGNMLTDEEAQILRESEIAQKRKELLEKVETARKVAREEFLKTPAGLKLERDISSQGLAGLKNSPQAIVGAGITASSFKPSNAQIDEAIREQKRQKEIADRLASEATKKKDDEARAKLSAIGSDVVNKDAIKKQKEAADKLKAEQDKILEDADKLARKKLEAQFKEEDDIKALQEKIAKGGKMTVSSIREIGGGLAGEGMTSGRDYAAEMLTLNEKMLIELQKINREPLMPTAPDTDFTKPVTSPGKLYTP